MNRSVLRAALFVISTILLGAAGWSAIVLCNNGVVLPFAIPGLVLLFGLVVERWRYKPVSTRLPGPDWVSTNERFIDPESGKTVTVFYQPSTGERRYVRPADQEPQRWNRTGCNDGAARHS